jgi:hypothetical protein
LDGIYFLWIGRISWNSGHGSKLSSPQTTQTSDNYLEKSAFIAVEMLNLYCTINEL